MFGLFSRQLDWENEFEKEAMEHLQFEYLEDENEVGTNQKGKKGCITKLARKVKNRKAAKTHGLILVAGTAPELIGHYSNGKPKYKKRKNANDFNFDEECHTCQKDMVSQIEEY